LDIKIEADEEYVNSVIPMKRGLICEIYRELTNDDKKKLLDDLFVEYSNHVDKFQIYHAYLQKYYQEPLTIEQIKNFITNDFDVIDSAKLKIYIKENSNSQSNSIFNFTSKEISYEKMFEVIKNIQDKEFIESLRLDVIKKKFLTGMNLDEKINFVDEYFTSSSDNLVVKFIKDLPSRSSVGKIFNDKISGNEEFKKFKNDIRYKLLRTKYFSELDEKEKENMLTYRLDVDSHYELYKLNESKYIEILCYNDLIDDYTFAPFSFDSFDFLNGFNDEVKTYLKTKIYADTNHITDFNLRHTPITSLDNYIDIMYFTHNPPTFLRMKDIKYYPDYVILINKYLEEIGYDLKKTNYLNMGPRIIFEYI
jgi:hypothetical protein